MPESAGNRVPLRVRPRHAKSFRTKQYWVDTSKPGWHDSFAKFLECTSIQTIDGKMLDTISADQLGNHRCFYANYPEERLTAANFNIELPESIEYMRDIASQMDGYMADQLDRFCKLFADFLSSISTQEESLDLMADFMNAPDDVCVKLFFEAHNNPEDASADFERSRDIMKEYIMNLNRQLGINDDWHTALSRRIKFIICPLVNDFAHKLPIMYKGWIARLKDGAERIEKSFVSPGSSAYGSFYEQKIRECVIAPLKRDVKKTLWDFIRCSHDESLEDGQTMRECNVKTRAEMLFDNVTHVRTNLGKVRVGARPTVDTFLSKKFSGSNSIPQDTFTKQCIKERIGFAEDIDQNSNMQQIDRDYRDRGEIIVLFCPEGQQFNPQTHMIQSSQLDENNWRQQLLDSKAGVEFSPVFDTETASNLAYKFNATGKSMGTMLEKSTQSHVKIDPCRVKVFQPEAFSNIVFIVEHAD